MNQSKPEMRTMGAKQLLTTTGTIAFILTSACSCKYSDSLQAEMACLRWIINAKESSQDNGGFLSQTHADTDVEGAQQAMRTCEEDTTETYWLGSVKEPDTQGGGESTKTKIFDY